VRKMMASDSLSGIHFLAASAQTPRYGGLRRAGFRCRRADWP
jgi:hypothetical protein